MFSKFQILLFLFFINCMVRAHREAKYIVYTDDDDDIIYSRGDGVAFIIFLIFFIFFCCAISDMFVYAPLRQAQRN